MITKKGEITEEISSFEMYGSAINGLALRGNSDLDMSVTYPDGVNDKKVIYALK